jgi:hypothetical protein
MVLLVPVFITLLAYFKHFSREVSFSTIDIVFEFVTVSKMKLKNVLFQNNPCLLKPNPN